ncbi:MAG: SDR family NAD(P)-dependent oxidoreductase [Sphingomonadaceae bacterium]
MRGLSGKVAIVTGGGSGIGEAICRRLADENVAIVILDRDAAGAQRVAGDIREGGGKGHAESADIRDYAAIVAAVARGEAALGPAAILVNCAGGDNIVNFLDTDEAHRDNVIAVNLKGPANVTHAVVKGMAERGAGRVVMISSEGGRIGSSGQAVYSACKAGQIALAKTLAREFARKGVTFNAVAPGPTATPMMDAALAGGDGEAGRKILEKIIRGVPLGRIGEPEDVSGIVAFLASDEAAFITGQVISVSGGLTMVG